MKHFAVYLAPLRFFAFLFFLLSGLSCSNLLKNQVDQVDTKAFLAKLQPSTDSLMRSAAHNAMLGAGAGAPEFTRSLLQGLKGAVDTLDPDIQKLMHAVDSLGSLSAGQLDKFYQKLDKQIAQLKTELKDEEIKAFLIGTLESMTGTLKKQTRSMLSDMIQEALTGMTTEDSREKITLILDQWLGKTTQDKAQALVHAALQPTLDSLLGRIDKIVHKDVPFVQRQANKLLWTLGILAAAIIGFVWYQRRKYARLVSLLAYQIDKIPTQGSYDELTKRIRDEAQKSGLEPLLREVLKEQGLNT